MWPDEQNPEGKGPEDYYDMDKHKPITLLTAKQEADMRNCLEIQCSPGNWDQSEYMRGMANGMIMMMSIVDETEPKFFTEEDGANARTASTRPMPGSGDNPTGKDRFDRSYNPRAG